jgi:hypothetical protein
MFYKLLILFFLQVFGQCNQFYTTSPFIDDQDTSHGYYNVSLFTYSTGYVTSRKNRCSIFSESLCRSVVNVDDVTFWSNGLPINGSAKLNCDCIIDQTKLDFFFSILQNTSLQYDITFVLPLFNL